MSKKKELEESLDNEEKAIDESIQKIKDQTDAVPFLTERKMEIEANRLLVQNVNEDAADEIYGKLWPVQKSDEQAYNVLRIKLGETGIALNAVFPSSSGTASIYQDLSYSVDQEIYSSPEGRAFVVQAYLEIADLKSHKSEIPKRLDQLHNGLGKMFSLVHDNVDKAKNKVITVKGAVSDMRDVLNQVWANLADRANKSCPEKWKGINNKQFKNEAYHKIVAECLIKDSSNKPRFELLLNNMYKLYGEMSETSIGKNPLNEDYEKLNEFYSRWVNQIDGVLGMVDWTD